MGKYGPWTEDIHERDELELKYRRAGTETQHHVGVSFTLEDDPEIYNMISEIQRAGISVSGSIRKDIEELIKELYRRVKGPKPPR